MEKQKALSLLTVKGFITHYFSLMKDPDITQVKAYEMTEKEFKKHFGQKRYSGFDSFRQVRNRYLKHKG